MEYLYERSLIMKKSVESIVRALENSGAMMKPYMSKDEMLDGYLKYQKAVLEQLFINQADKFKLYDAVNYLEIHAAEKGIGENPVIVKAITDLRNISREIATTINGKCGEESVRKALNYTNRNIITMPNIHLSDGFDRTEIDQIVITSNGILILEVKHYKKNIVISPSGKIENCDKTLGEQMNVKRHLLRTKLEQALYNTYSDLPLHIESRVVFSNPDSNVTDNYKLEKLCYKAHLPHEIENFTSNVKYSNRQMTLIETLITEFAEEETYPVKYDFNRIRKTFAEALVLLENEEKEDKVVEEAEEDKIVNFDLNQNNFVVKPRKKSKVDKFVAIAVHTVLAAASVYEYVKSLK